MTAGRTIGRYQLHAQVGADGMATVHLGRLLGPVGFARMVAIKRLHPQFAKDPEFVSMFVDEARLAARIRHPNVVSTLDVVAEEGELFLVMDYVHGESLSRILKTLAAHGERIPPKMAAAILVSTLHGLHAAHEANDEKANPLNVVHRDVSPENILVGVDGIPRVLDFGVAKAAGRVGHTRDGQLRGKIAYMAPEQLRQGEIGRAVDIYAAGVVLWEALANKRLVVGDSEAAVIERVLYGSFERASDYTPELPRAIDDVLQKALSRDPQARYATAREMATAVEAVLGVASMHELADWVSSVARVSLERRARAVAAIEADTTAPHVEEVSSRRHGRDETTVTTTTLTTPQLELPSPARALDPHRVAPWRRRAIIVAAGALIAVVGVGSMIAATSGPSHAPAREEGNVGMGARSTKARATASTPTPSVTPSTSDVAAPASTPSSEPSQAPSSKPLEPAMPTPLPPKRKPKPPPKPDFGY